MLELDINECASETDSCDDNAICTNVEGSYHCMCIIGYAGNGTDCKGMIVYLFIYLC